MTVLFKNMGMAEVTSIIADICDGVSSNVIFPFLNTGVPLTSNIAWPPGKYKGIILMNLWSRSQLVFVGFIGSVSFKVDLSIP